jgi:hypothetical protein
VAKTYGLAVSGYSGFLTVAFRLGGERQPWFPSGWAQAWTVKASNQCSADWLELLKATNSCAEDWLGTLRRPERLSSATARVRKRGRRSG